MVDLLSYVPDVMFDAGGGKKSSEAATSDAEEPRLRTDVSDTESQRPPQTATHDRRPDCRGQSAQEAGVDVDHRARPLPGRSEQNEAETSGLVCRD